MPQNTQPTSIIRDFKKYTFAKGNDFRWSAPNATIYYLALKTANDIWLLLHEISHAELQHNRYSSDIELIRIESEAWQHAAQVLAPRYSIKIDTNFIEDNLDTYRYWLQKRSTCPNCQQNGVQATQNTYSCINCRCLWQVNDARVCALRRTKL